MFLRRFRGILMCDRTKGKGIPIVQSSSLRRGSFEEIAQVSIGFGESLSWELMAVILVLGHTL